MSERYTANSTADLEKLTDMIHKLLSIVWGQDWGAFSEEHPTDNNPEQHRLPHITYSLISRRKTENRGVKHQEFAPIPDPEHPGETITPLRTWFDCRLEFTVYANTNKESRVMAQRFEEFMETYKGFFKQEGVSEIIFEEELRQGVSTDYRQDIPHRTIQYLVRIERVVEKRSFDLKNVNAALESVEVGIEVGDDTYQSQFQDNSNPVKTHLGSSNFLDLYNQNFPR